MSLCHQHINGIDPEFQSKCRDGCQYTERFTIRRPRGRTVTYELCQCGGVRFFNSEDCETCRAKADKDPTLRQALPFPGLLDRRAILKVFVDWEKIRRQRKTG